MCELEEALAWCRARGLSLVALDPSGDSLFEAELTGPTAMAVGAEHEGVSTELRRAADRLVSVPMAGTVDSLNAATALAIGLFEAVRQRR
jgi:TrmH family RNA methyltransferase